MKGAVLINAPVDGHSANIIRPLVDRSQSSHVPCKNGSDRETNDESALLQNPSERVKMENRGAHAPPRLQPCYWTVYCKVWFEPITAPVVPVIETVVGPEAVIGK